jgi:hypothetical protein
MNKSAGKDVAEMTLESCGIYNGLGMALNSAMRVCARVQIPVCPEPPFVFSHELLGGLRTGFLVVSPLRIACAFLHEERGQGSTWLKLKGGQTGHRANFLPALAPDYPV